MLKYFKSVAITLLISISLPNTGVALPIPSADQIMMSLPICLQPLSTAPISLSCLTPKR